MTVTYVRSAEGKVSRPHGRPHAARLNFRAAIPRLPLRSGHPSFLAGLLVGGLLSLFPVPLVQAGHLNTGCEIITWVESVNEDNIRTERGVHALIDIDYPRGG